MIVVHECVDSRNLQQHRGLICMLDFENAYDIVDWDFLQYMMVRMGFGKKWTEWIHSCVSSAHFFGFDQWFS